MKTFTEYMDERYPNGFDEGFNELIEMAEDYGKEMYDLGQLKENESKTEVTH